MCTRTCFLLKQTISPRRLQIKAVIKIQVFKCCVLIYFDILSWPSQGRSFQIKSPMNSQFRTKHVPHYHKSELQKIKTKRWIFPCTRCKNSTYRYNKIYLCDISCDIGSLWYLLPTGRLNPVKSKKFSDEGVVINTHVMIVVGQHSQQDLQK